MKTTKLVIGASLLIALAAMPIVSASEDYVARVGDCTTPTPDLDTPICIVGNPVSPGPDPECSIFDSILQTALFVIGGQERNTVVDCLGQ